MHMEEAPKEQEQEGVVGDGLKYSQVVGVGIGWLWTEEDWLLSAPSPSTPSLFACN